MERHDRGPYRAARTRRATSRIRASAAPALPTAPTLNAPVVSGSTVSFSWTPGLGGGAPTSYVLLASVTPGGPVIASLPVSGTSIGVPNVPSGTYYVRVSGVNSVGTGAPSNSVTVVVP